MTPSRNHSTLVRRTVRAALNSLRIDTPEIQASRVRIPHHDIRGSAFPHSRELRSATHPTIIAELRDADMGYVWTVDHNGRTMMYLNEAESPIGR